MPDNDLENLLRKAHDGRNQRDSNIPNASTVFERVSQTRRKFPNDDRRNRRVTRTRGEGELNLLILPLNQTESIVYVDNLLDLVIDQRRSNIVSAQVYAHQEISDVVGLCSEISSTILQYKQQFPEDYSTELTRREKRIVLQLLSFPIIPSRILDIVSKESISPTGERHVEKTRIFPGIAKIVDGVQYGITFGGGTIGAGTGVGIGSLAGPPGMIVGGIIGGVGGAVLAYFSPALVALGYRKKKISKKEAIKREYDRARVAIDNITNQIRLQEVPINIAVLQDYRDDNISTYLSTDPNIQFRNPETITQHEWVHRGFKSIVENQEMFERVTYNLQRYYRAKVRQRQS